MPNPKPSATPRPTPDPERSVEAFLYVNANPAAATHPNLVHQHPIRNIEHAAEAVWRLVWDFPEYVDQVPNYREVPIEGVDAQAGVWLVELPADLRDHAAQADITALFANGWGFISPAAFR